MEPAASLPSAADYTTGTCRCQPPATLRVAHFAMLDRGKTDDSGKTFQEAFNSQRIEPLQGEGEPGELAAGAHLVLPVRRQTSFRG